MRKLEECYRKIEPIGMHIEMLEEFRIVDFRIKRKRARHLRRPNVWQGPQL